MKLELKLIAAWFCLLGLLGLLELAPHREIEPAAIINVSLQLLLAILSMLIANRSVRKSQRFLFLNFGLLFIFSLPLYLSQFVGTSLFPGSRYSAFYYHFYVNKLGMNFTLAFALLYVGSELLLPKRPVLLKCVVTFVAACAIVLPFYLPYLPDARSLRHQAEYEAFQAAKTIAPSSDVTRLITVSDDQIAAMIAGIVPGPDRPTQTTADRIREVQVIRPFFREGGETALFWKPLDMATMYISGILLVVIAAILFGLYTARGPVHAYLDKILILFLPFCVLEIVHIYGYMYSSSLSTFKIIFTASQYVTIACLLTMLYAFELKLRFVLSTAGKYYEYAIGQSPERVTRWRDEIDNYILRTFFRRNNFTYRLADTPISTSDPKPSQQERSS